MTPGQANSEIGLLGSQAAICAREVKPSLVRIWSTCISAVRREITSSAAIAPVGHPPRNELGDLAFASSQGFVGTFGARRRVVYLDDCGDHRLAQGLVERPGPCVAASSCGRSKPANRCAGVAEFASGSSDSRRPSADSQTVSATRRSCRFCSAQWFSQFVNKRHAADRRRGDAVVLGRVGDTANRKAAGACEGMPSGILACISDAVDKQSS